MGPPGLQGRDKERVSEDNEAEEFLRFIVVIGDGRSRWDSLPSGEKWQRRAVGAAARARAVPIFIGMGDSAPGGGHGRKRWARSPGHGASRPHGAQGARDGNRPIG